MIGDAQIGVVVLTYNSASDLPTCLDGLFSQRGVGLRVIVVDNASDVVARDQMEDVFLSRAPRGKIFDVAASSQCELGVENAVFLKNDRNSGYSAGNNIGAKLATESGCQAVLIINPDIQIQDTTYVRTLYELLISEPDLVVAASAIRNLSGKNENPMAELSFFCELFLPLEMIVAVLGIKRKEARISFQRDEVAEKVSGSCFLVRSDFLQEIGFFDEGVFLYCEEAILAKQIRQRGYRIIFCPRIEAVHAHRPNEKGDPVRRQILWSRSRKYYHAHYAGYGTVRRTMLSFSHSIVVVLTWLHSRMTRPIR